MCGILGGWHRGKKFPDTLIHAALAEMKNRGPDDEGGVAFNENLEMLFKIFLNV